MTKFPSNTGSKIYKKSPLKLEPARAPRRNKHPTEPPSTPVMFAILVGLYFLIKYTIF